MEEARTGTIYDVVVIGGGVLGCMAARELTKYRLRVALLEKREDVCTGISRANTAIVYAGYDNQPGTKKAEFCVRANRNFDLLCGELGVPFRRCGSLMICYGPRGEQVLLKKYRQGMENGVPGLRLLSGEETEAMEPSLKKGVVRGLYAPTAGTVNPWELGIAAYENARENGCGIFLGTKVIGIAREEGLFRIDTEKTEEPFPKKEPEIFLARAVLNCAGLFADEVREMLFPPRVRIFPGRADYLVFDRRTEGILHHVIFQEPEEKGKGLTLVPTTEGTLLAGPSEQKGEKKEDFTTTEEGLAFLERLCREIVPSLPMDLVIRNFGANRPNPFDVFPDGEGGFTIGDRSIHSFVIDQPEECPAMVSLVGIKTPGLTCSPELAAHAVALLQEGLGEIFQRREDFRPVHKAPVRVSLLTLEEKRKLAEEDPAYSRIVCLCEGITEGEIRDAIRRGAVTPDGVKRRCGAGLGRCQGARCREKIEEMLKEGGKRLQGQEAAETDREKDREKDRETLAAPSGKPERASGEVLDYLIIGGGAAGMTAAAALWRKDPSLRILLADREKRLGGLLRQCIHTGFGLGYFGEEMNGPAYADRLEKLLSACGVEVRLQTEVVSLGDAEETGETERLHEAVLAGPESWEKVRFRKAILSSGCRERAAGSLGMWGSRPEGVFMAGSLQKRINLSGYQPGKRAVILGSGDIGLILARRLTLLGTRVLLVTEIQNESPAMERNRKNCLEAFSIPLKTRTMVSSLQEKDGALSGVTVRNLETGEEEEIACDLLVVAAGLIPDQSLREEYLRETKKEPADADSWLFLCGNCEHVHPIVDGVSLQAEALAESQS